MAYLYGRRARLTVAGLVIDESLRIAFEVERTADPSQDRGYVKIHNLNDEHASRVQDRGESVVLEAGYPESRAIIFDGAAQRVRLARENLSHITRIDLGDMVRQVARLGGHFSASYAGPVPVRRIALDIILALELGAGPLDPIPADATVTDFYWANRADAALTVLLAGVGCTWYENGGLVRINRPSQIQSDAPRLVTSPATGLVGTITEHDQDDGYSCTMFMQPRATVGGELLVRDVAQGVGLFKIIAVRHVGDTWSGKFVTELQLRETER